MSTALTVVEQVRTQLTAMQPQFAAALPKHVSVEKFTRVVMTAIQTAPSLLEADRRTLLETEDGRHDQAGHKPPATEGFRQPEAV